MSAATPSTPGSSRALRRTPLAWDVTLDEPDKRDETRFPDFSAFFLLPFSSLIVPFVGLPANESAMLALCALAVGRRPTTREPVPVWFAGLLAVLLVYFVATSYEHGPLDYRRLLHLALYCALAMFLASGRIHLPSAARGAALGLVAAVGLSLAGLAPEAYSGRLSGFFGDPNGGGYILTVVGAVAIGLCRTRRLRLMLLVVLPVAVVLTFSRTSLLALAFAVVWVLVGRRLGPVPGVGLGGVMIYLVGHIPDQVRLFGPFSDRTGSDALRQRIIAQERLDIAQSPLFGSGAGSAHVDLDGNTFFYHSSYLALQREGGQVAVGLLVALVALVFLANLRRSSRDPWLEAALICLMVCAVNLGEVLLELPAAVAIGVLMHRALNPDPDDPVPHHRQTGLRAVVS